MSDLDDCPICGKSRQNVDQHIRMTEDDDHDVDPEDILDSDDASDDESTESDEQNPEEDDTTVANPGEDEDESTSSDDDDSQSTTNDDSSVTQMDEEDQWNPDTTDEESQEGDVEVETVDDVRDDGKNGGSDDGLGIPIPMSTTTLALILGLVAMAVILWQFTRTADDSNSESTTETYENVQESDDATDGEPEDEFPEELQDGGLTSA